MKAHKRIQIEKEIEKQMQKVRDSGLRAGSKAICGVVLEKAKDDTKTESERLLDIISFCEKSLGIFNKK